MCLRTMPIIRMRTCTKQVSPLLLVLVEIISIQYRRYLFLLRLSHTYIAISFHSYYSFIHLLFVVVVVFCSIHCFIHLFNNIR